MSDLVGNPEDRFSRVEAQIVFDHLRLSLSVAYMVFMCTIGQNTNTFPSRVVCAYALFSFFEMTGMCAYWNMCAN